MKPILTSCACAAPAIVSTAAAAKNDQRLMGFLPWRVSIGIPTSRTFLVQRPECLILLPALVRTKAAARASLIGGLGRGVAESRKGVPPPDRGACHRAGHFGPDPLAVDLSSRGEVKRCVL